MFDGCNQAVFIHRLSYLKAAVRYDDASSPAQAQYAVLVPGFVRIPTFGTFLYFPSVIPELLNSFKSIVFAAGPAAEIGTVSGSVEAEFPAACRACFLGLVCHNTLSIKLRLKIFKRIRQKSEKSNPH
jgi:hypothetical protein